jgi:signal transduction histidine kinase
VGFSGKPAEVLVERRQAWLHIEVQDHGIGFQAHLAEELFSPFTIADAEHHSRGSGLSLAIARVIVGAHGGELTARSEGLGCGATFCAELPVRE